MYVPQKKKLFDLTNDFFYLFFYELKIHGIHGIILDYNII